MDKARGRRRTRAALDTRRMAVRPVLSVSLRQEGPEAQRRRLRRRGLDPFRGSQEGRRRALP